MSDTIFTTFLGNVDTVVGSYLIDGYGRVRDACLTPLRLCLAIYVSVYGVLMLTGRAQLSYRDLIGRVGVMLFVYTLATNADVYTRYLESLFVESPAAITNAIVGGGAGEQNSAMDRFYDMGMDAGNKIWDRGHVTGPWSPFIAAIVVYALIVAVAAYAAFLLALAKVALAILLILTPLMALTFLFQPTRRLFDGWLGQVIHFALVPVLVYGILGLILAIAQQDLATLDASADHATMEDVLDLALVGVVAVLLLAQVNRITQGIAGGISLSTLGSYREASEKGLAASRRAAQWMRHLGRSHNQSSQSHSGTRRGAV